MAADVAREIWKLSNPKPTTEMELTGLLEVALDTEDDDGFYGGTLEVNEGSELPRMHVLVRRMPDGARRVFAGLRAFDGSKLHVSEALFDISDASARAAFARLMNETWNLIGHANYFEEDAIMRLFVKNTKGRTLAFVYVSACHGCKDEASCGQHCTVFHWPAALEHIVDVLTHASTFEGSDV